MKKAANFAHATQRQSRESSRRNASVLSVASALLAAVSVASIARAGVVITPAGRVEGPVALSGGNLTVGGKALAWTDVLVAVADAPDARSAGEALYLDSGEVWGGQVLKLASGRVTLVSSLFGTREVDQAVVRSIDFVADLPAPDAQASGVLFRRKGSPVRGSLVALEPQKITVETALGAVPLDRGTVKRYVFAGTPRKTAPADDEVTLIDGSVLLGKLSLTGAGLTLKHALMGDLAIAPSQWRSLRRRTEKVAYLADQSPAKVETFPLIRRPANPPVVDRARSQSPGSPLPVHVCRIQAWPRTIVSYVLPGEAGQKVSFRAQVGLAEGSRGALTAKMKIGEKVVSEVVLDPKDAKPAPVAFEADAGDTVSLEVDFDKSIRFPCSATMDDPLVLRK